MDSNIGGPSSERRKSAAEIAREKVLAVYSSTVEGLKKLPNRKNSSGNEYIAPPVPGAIYSADNQNQSIAGSGQNTTANYNTADQYTQTLATEQQPSYYDQSYQDSYDQNSQSYSDRTAYQEQTTNYQNNYQDYYQQQPTQVTYQSQTYPEQVYQSNEPISSAESAPNYQSTDTTSSLKDAPINQTAVTNEWQQYHSAWQNYYQNYYSDYYAKAAQNYLATEKLKSERIANGSERRERRAKRLAPVFIVLAIGLVLGFLQYNRLIFAPLMAYVAPDAGSVATSIEAVDPNVTQAVSPEPRLLIPKLNIDVPVAFGISTNDVDEAMAHGVAQFSIPGANALPGQIGNLVISGHSAGDVYSNNPYKFIFSGLERLEVGDIIYINFESVRYTYQMTKSEVVEPSNVGALIYATDKPMLTLITCTPLGTSRYRLLITAEQIAPSYEPLNPDDQPTTEDTPPADVTMPANEPSFFENIWNGLFGS
mgnify:CR=1 FL=1